MKGQRSTSREEQSLHGFTHLLVPQISWVWAIALGSGIIIGAKPLLIKACYSSDSTLTQIITQTPCLQALSGRVVGPGTETVGETEPSQGNGSEAKIQRRKGESQTWLRGQEKPE